MAYTQSDILQRFIRGGDTWQSEPVRATLAKYFEKYYKEAGRSDVTFEQNRYGAEQVLYKMLKGENVSWAEEGQRKAAQETIDELMAGNIDLATGMPRLTPTVTPSIPGAPPTTTTPQTLASVGGTTAKKEVAGFPKSSDEYDKWIAQGRTFEGGKWYEPTTGVAPTPTALTGGETRVNTQTGETETYSEVTGQWVSESQAAKYPAPPETLTQPIISTTPTTSDAITKRIEELKKALEELSGKVGAIKEPEALDWDKLTKAIIDIVDAMWKKKAGTIDEFTWTDADVADVKAQFDELYEPYYKAMAAVPQRTARESIEELERTAGLALTRESRNLESALAESRASMASRGLAFSGIRGKEEARTQEVSAEEMQRIRDLAATGRRSELAGLESQIGTSAVQSQYPGYALAPEYAGLGIEFPRGTAITGIPGTIPTGQAMAYSQELARREAEARSKYISDILMKELYA